MVNRRITFALFAAAILFSMVREWTVPDVCARALLFLTAQNQR